MGLWGRGFYLDSIRLLCGLGLSITNLVFILLAVWLIAIKVKKVREREREREKVKLPKADYVKAKFIDPYSKCLSLMPSHHNIMLHKANLPQAN